MKDIYLYPGENVLKNKLDIHDSKLLDEKEGQFVSLMSLTILEKPFKINSIFDIRKIHKILFGDIYEWAGENRKINVYKSERVLDGLSVSYSDYRYIDEDLKHLDIEFKSIDWKKITTNEKLDTLVEMISRLWRIHCFREGNTRSITMFLYLLMKQTGLKVNLDFIGRNAGFFRDSLVLASIDEYSEFDKLRDILSDSVFVKIDDGIEKKYKSIKGYNLDKYEFKKHVYKD